jgi:hypothetical protein
MDDGTDGTPEDKPSGVQVTSDEPPTPVSSDTLHRFGRAVEELESLARSLKANQRRSQFRIV